MHDLRGVRRNHAGTRRLLRTVVEIELDVLVRRQVEAERRERLQAHLGGAVLRVRRVERRQPTDVAHVRRRRLRLALGPEQPLEPLLAQLDERRLDLLARRHEDRLELAQRDLLLLLVARDRIGLAAQVRLELLVRADQVESLLVEVRGAPPVELSELVAILVLGDDRELCERRAQRKLLVLELHACGQLRVLELVVALRELGGHEAALTCLAQPVEPLSPLAVAPVLLLAQRLELLATEEVGVARDDRGLLRDLLLPHANGAPFLGALVQVPLELFLELRGAADRSR